MNRQLQAIVLMLCGVTCIAAFFALAVVSFKVAAGVWVCALVIISYKLAESFIDD